MSNKQQMLDGIAEAEQLYFTNYQLGLITYNDIKDRPVELLTPRLLGFKQKWARLERGM